MDESEYRRVSDPELYGMIGQQIRKLLVYGFAYSQASTHLQNLYYPSASPADHEDMFLLGTLDPKTQLRVIIAMLEKRMLPSEYRYDSSFWPEEFLPIFYHFRMPDRESMQRCQHRFLENLLMEVADPRFLSIATLAERILNKKFPQDARRLLACAIAIQFQQKYAQNWSLTATYREMMITRSQQALGNLVDIQVAFNDRDQRMTPPPISLIEDETVQGIINLLNGDFAAIQGELDELRACENGDTLWKMLCGLHYTNENIFATRDRVFDQIASLKIRRF